MDDKYFKLYLKYKSKYIAAKKELQNNQIGGEKRFLKKQEKNQDALLLTPIGESNNSMQSILLEPEVNFIVNKCSKNKLKCDKKKILSLLSKIYSFEIVNENISKKLKDISKEMKLPNLIVENIFKYHKMYKSEIFSEES